MLALGSAALAPCGRVFDPFNVGLASACFEAWVDSVEDTRREFKRKTEFRKVAAKFATQVQELRAEFCEEMAAVHSQQALLQNEFRTSEMEEARDMARAARLEDQVQGFHSELDAERVARDIAVQQRAKLEDEVSRLRRALELEQESLFEASFQGRSSVSNCSVCSKPNETKTPCSYEAWTTSMRQEVRRECKEFEHQRDEALLEREEMRLELAVSLCATHSPRTPVTTRTQLAPAREQLDICGVPGSSVPQAAVHGPPASPTRKARLEFRGRPATVSWKTPPDTPPSVVGSERGWIDDRRARVPTLTLPNASTNVVKSGYRSTSPLRNAAARLDHLEQARDQLANAGFLVRRNGSLP